MITLCVEKNYYMYYKEAVIQHLIINNIIYVYLSALAFIIVLFFVLHITFLLIVYVTRVIHVAYPASVRLTHALKANVFVYILFAYACVSEGKEDRERV